MTETCSYCVSRKAFPLLWWEQTRSTRWMETRYLAVKQSGESLKVRQQFNISGIIIYFLVATVYKLWSHFWQSIYIGATKCSMTITAPNYHISQDATLTSYCRQTSSFSTANNCCVSSTYDICICSSDLYLPSCHFLLQWQWYFQTSNGISTCGSASNHSNTMIYI